MLPRNHPDRIRIVFDDHRLVANAGLLLPATLAQHLGLGELVDHHLNLGSAPGRANTGDKMMTLVASALAGGDCIGCAARWWDSRCSLQGQSTLGTFLRSFRWGHALDEPGAAGTGLGRRGGTRRRAVNHRPRFHHLRDFAVPAAGRGRRHRGRVDVPAHCPGRRPLPDSGTGALRGQLTVRADSGFYAHAIRRLMDVRYSIPPT